jgi:hypothetical protein
MIRVEWILDWLKDTGEYVDGINGMTGEVDFEGVIIDGCFNLFDLAQYLSNKEKGVE